MTRFDIVPSAPGDANLSWMAKERGGRNTSHQTQQAAIDAARRRGRNGDEVYVHGRNGRIRDQFTIGG